MGDSTEAYIRATCLRIAKAARELADMLESRGKTEEVKRWRKTAEQHEERANER